MAGKSLLIVWYSRTGAARQMAQAAAQGAREAAGIAVRHLAVGQAGPADMLAADGYIFAAPEMLAALAGLAKDFFDRCYYPVLDRINGRPYAALIAAGSDGQNAARQLARIATGWRLREVAAPTIICTHAQTPERILAEKHLAEAELARCREVGAALAAGIEAGIF